MSDLGDYREEFLSRGRKSSNFFEGPDRRYEPLKEISVASEFVASSKPELNNNLTHSPKGQDPPDCIAFDEKGNKFGIEVTELVSEEAIKENEHGRKCFYEWDVKKIIDKLNIIIKKKDSKPFNGGPYFKKILVIYTDEFTIACAGYENLFGELEEKTFQHCKNIDEVFLLLSYQPKRGYPVCKLNLGPI